MPLTYEEEEKQRKKEMELEKELERERERKREMQREGGGDKRGKGVVVISYGDVPIDRQMLLSFYILDRFFYFYYSLCLCVFLNNIFFFIFFSRLIEKCLPNFFSHMKHQGIDPGFFETSPFSPSFFFLPPSFVFFSPSSIRL